MRVCVRVYVSVCVCGYARKCLYACVCVGKHVGAHEYALVYEQEREKERKRKQEVKSMVFRMNLGINRRFLGG